MAEKIEIDKEDLQALFDLAVNSMNFGSGFWVNEDVEVARRIATLIGVDPIEGTPREFRCKYEGHKPYEEAAYGPQWKGPRDSCSNCYGHFPECDITKGGSSNG